MSFDDLRRYKELREIRANISLMFHVEQIFILIFDGD
jgi:hypothetical protein